jgi:hypothetical protein
MLKETAELWAFGAAKVPLILFLRPRVVQVSMERVVLTIPLSRRTKNHLGSMYFGALSTGADMVPGIMAVTLGRKLKKKVAFALKEFEARFRKKAEQDVTFACSDMAVVERAIQASSESNERRDARVRVTATIANGRGEEEVATFDMVLSVRAK